MKQTLNEEISRIKSMMGCCKGKMNEAVQPGSQQEAQMIQMFAQDIQEMGITQDDLEIDNTASLSQVKEKIANEVMNPFLQKATVADLKLAIKALKKIKQKAKSMPADSKNTQQTEKPVDDTAAQPLNEQGIFDDDYPNYGNFLVNGFIDALKLYLMTPTGAIGGPLLISLGTGPYIAIICTWLILCAFRCIFYDIFGDYETNNIVNKIIQIVTVDLANIFSRDPYVKGCGIYKQY